MSEARRRALQQVDALESDLLLQSSEDLLPQHELRLIGFCLRHLQAPWRPLIAIPDADISVQLDHNDIHHRRVDPPREPWSSEFPMLIVHDQSSGEALALFRDRGRNWFYSADRDQRWPVPKSARLDGDAFEIYPSLPAKVTGPLRVISFAFDTEWRAIWALVLASAAVMGFHFSIPVFTNLLVNRVLPENDSALLLQGLAIVLVVVAGVAAAQYLQTMMMLRIESITDLRLQTAVFDRVMRLPMRFVSQYTTGDLASRANSISQLRQVLGSGVLSTLLSAVFSLGYFILMLVYDSKLAIWAALFTLVSLLGLLVLTIRDIELQKPLLETGAEITNFSLQSVFGLSQIRSAAAEPFVLLRWLKEVNRYALLQLRSNIYSDGIEMFGTLVSPLASLMMFTVVTHRLLANASSSAEFEAILVSFISFNAAFSGFNASLSQAANLTANTFGRASVLWKRAEPVLYAEVERGYEPDAVHHQVEGHYRFRDVTYTFPGASGPILRNLSFEITPGEHTVITGPSGCGKSTLVRMFLGFVDPQAGEVLVDGIPLPQLSIRHYRRQLGVVLQTAHLNGGSIYDVVCGGLALDEDTIWEALRAASVADEVEAMPMKLETLLMDGAGNVSGGQAQRIAIARALIHQPQVLIMDEATSALDPASQQRINATVQSLGITRISIAHRLATIKDADRILVLRDGEISENGTWDELCEYGYLAQMMSKGQ